MRFYNPEPSENMSNKEPANSDAVEWFYYRPGRRGQKDSGSETVTYLTRPSRSSIYVEECLDLHRIYLASLRLVESLGDGVKFADPGSVAWAWFFCLVFHREQTVS